MLHNQYQKNVFYWKLWFCAGQRNFRSRSDLGIGSAFQRRFFSCGALIEILTSYPFKLTTTHTFSEPFLLELARSKANFGKNIWECHFQKILQKNLVRIALTTTALKSILTLASFLNLRFFYSSDFSEHTVCRFSCRFSKYLQPK